MVVDVVDDTFVRATPARVRVGSSDRWQSWLPELMLRPVQDRGEQGLRWAAGWPGAGSVPATTGTAEVWLERVPGGTVVHLYVRLHHRGSGRAAPPGHRGPGGRRARGLPDRLRRTWKRQVHGFKDVLEGET